MASYRRKRSKRNRSRKLKRGNKGRRIYIGGTNPSDKCIFVELYGGLGNQLFMYAAALTVKNRTKLPICLLPITENHHSTEDNRKIIFKQGTSVEVNDIKPRMNSSQKLLEFIHAPHNSWKNTNIPENSSKNVSLSRRYYQNYKSIISVIPAIRDECKTVFEQRYAGFKDTIPTTSAFMHVRKGDFGQFSLKSEYYQRGLKELDPVDSIKAIYILSDDIPWCKEQNWQSSKKIEWFDSPDEFKCLYLMSLCVAGAVLSGSTFSAWGAILGPDSNPSSTIIYPAEWVTGTSKILDFPSRWKAI